MRATRRQLIAASALAPLAAAAPARAADPDRERAERAVSSAVHGEQTTAVAFEAIANGDLLREENVEMMRVLLDHAKAHVAALEELYERQTGKKPPLAPRRTQIPGLTELSDERGALRLAVRLTNQAIALYLDAVRLYRSPAMLSLMAGAMGSDCQHLVLLRQLLGDEPVPEPFERGG